MITRYALPALAIGLCLAAAANVAACSSDDPANVPPDRDASVGVSPVVPLPDAAAQASDAAVDTGLPPFDAGTDADAGNTCGTQPKKACTTCCETTYAKGYAVLEKAVRDCACDEDVCAEVCEDTYCATKPKKPNEACQACLDLALTKKDGGAIDAGNDGGPSCAKAGKEACAGNPDCVAYSTCQQSCAP